MESLNWFSHAKAVIMPLHKVGKWIYEAMKDMAGD